MSRPTCPSRSRQLSAELAADVAYYCSIFGIEPEEVCPGPEVDRRPPLRAVAPGVWRRELRRGQRAATDFDALWAAAAAEQQALEHESAGLTKIAAGFWAAAAAGLAKAARSRAA
jgi:hypothetical protein